MSARWQRQLGAGARGLLAVSVLESPAHRCRASGTVDRDVEPPRSALVVSCCCPELPQMVSGCVVPAATVIHRPVLGCFSLVPLERRVRSRLRVDLGRRGGWRLVATSCRMD